jgi:vitamin B12 transporter
MHHVPAHRRASLTLALPLALLPSFLCATASAQDLPVEAGPEIVISASRVPLPARETGAAVTVLTGRELESRGIRIVSDVLRDVPGVAVNRSGPVGAFTQIRIRGAEGNHTLVLIDGIEVNNPASSSEFDFANLLAADVARIEVLRGPQSALYGSDAVGGVINIVTRRPGKGWSGTLRGEAGSFASKDMLANVGYGAERGYFSASLSRFDTNGISEADARNGNSEADAYRNGTARLKAGFKPLPDLSFDAVGMEISSHREGDDQVASLNVVDGEGASSTHQRYGMVSARWVPFGGAWEHILRAAYGEDGTDFLDAGRSRTFLSEGTKTKFDYQTNVTFRTEGSTNAEHIVTLAVEQERESQLTDSSFSGRSKVAVTNRGYVGEYRVSLWDHLFLSGSLRHDDNDPLFEDQTTWRGTVAYIHDPWDTRFHGSVGRGVKNPTLFELFGSTPTFTGNPNLTPEENIGIDFGVEKTMLDGRLIVDATVFRNRFKNFISGSGNTATNVAGTTETDGLELTLVARPLGNLKIDGSYTFTATRDSSGTDLIRRPRHMASLQGTYDFRLGQRPARASLGVRYNGDQKDTVFDSFFPAMTHTELLEGYTLVNAGFSWRIHDNVELFARGENLLDQHYQEVFGYGTTGLALFAGITLRFGPTGGE